MTSYKYGWDDQQLEIPLLKHLIDPTLYQGDYYVESLKQNFSSYFYPILAKLINYAMGLFLLGAIYAVARRVYEVHGALLRVRQVDHDLRRLPRDHLDLRALRPVSAALHGDAHGPGSQARR